MTLVRVPKERGGGDADRVPPRRRHRQPLLAYTAALAAGLDGIRRGLEPPEPIEGMLYELPEDEQGDAAADDFEEALEALEGTP